MAEEKPKTLWSLYLILILVFINSANNGYDGSMFGSVLSFQEFKDYFGINAQDTLTGRLASIINVGNIIGGFAAMWVVDFRGRRFALVFGSVLIIIGAILQGTTVGDTQLIVGRCIVGIGLPITVSAAPIFVAELSPPHIRGTLVGLYNCFWYAGSFLSRVTVVSLNDYVGDLKWRLPLFLQMTPSVIVVLTIWLLPESPRYLILKGRDEEATRILAKYHAGGDENAEIVTSQVSEIKNALAVEEATRPDSFSSSMRGLIQILSKKSDLHRLFLAWMIAWYPGVSIISYYLSPMLTNAGITDSATQLWIGIGIDICSFLAAITGSLFFVERFGRRKMALSATFITVAAMLVMGLCTKATQDDDGNAVPNKTATIFAVLAIYIVQIGFSGNWTPLQALYPTEIFNFSLRAKAAGITNVFWGTSGFLFNNVNPIGLGNLHWKYYMVQMVWNGVWIGFVYFLMVETKGRTLEQLDALFNKPNAVKESLKAVEPDQTYETSEKKVVVA